VASFQLVDLTVCQCLCFRGVQKAMQSGVAKIGFLIHTNSMWAHSYWFTPIWVIRVAKYY